MLKANAIKIQEERDRIGLKFKKKKKFIRLAASVGYFGKEKKKTRLFWLSILLSVLSNRLKQDSRI